MGLLDDLAAAVPTASGRHANCSVCQVLDTMTDADRAQLLEVWRGEHRRPDTGRLWSDRDVSVMLTPRAGKKITVHMVTVCRLEHHGITRR